MNHTATRPGEARPGDARPGRARPGGAGPGEGRAVTEITAGRAALDALDEEIRRLLAERVAVSRQVQALRRGAGEPGIQHARENQVIAGYVDALGGPGADIALAVLQLCRGRLG